MRGPLPLLSPDVKLASYVTVVRGLETAVAVVLTRGPVIHTLSPVPHQRSSLSRTLRCRAFRAVMVPRSGGVLHYCDSQEEYCP